MIRRAALLLCLALPHDAMAQGISGCTKVERQVVEEAFRNAKRLTLSAAAAVGDTDIYARWFGHYTPKSSDVVRGNLKAIFGTIRSGRIATTCAPIGFGACDRRTYAFVYADRPFALYVCPAFFSLPTMASLRPGSNGGDNGTREGTFIHEISHFTDVSATVDYCYSRSSCTAMASRNAVSALSNADSYQYFSEDVTHFRTDSMADKPSP